MINKKKMNTLCSKCIICIICVICVLCTLSITYLIYYKSKNTFKNSSNTVKEPFDFFSCTMNLNDIDPKFANNYKNYDGKSVKCGPCEGATLHINISTCPTDINGNLSTSCIPNASIISSYGNPITFKSGINTSQITPYALDKFFCPI